MPTYMGEEVGQPFLDWIVSVYKGGYEAMHPQHLAPTADDLAITVFLEGNEVRGGPDADALGRALSEPVIP